MHCESIIARGSCATRATLSRCSGGCTRRRGRTGRTGCSNGRIWILARYDIVRLRTISHGAPTTSYDVVLNIVRTASYVRCYVRLRTVTYESIRCRTGPYVCQHRRCYIRHRRLDIQCRTSMSQKMHVVYDHLEPVESLA